MRSARSTRYCTSRPTGLPAAPFLDISQRIGQGQTAFGVGVEDFDRLTGNVSEDIARLVGIAVRQVFSGGRHADHVYRLPSSAAACTAPNTLAAPPMSYFISSMAAPGLRLTPSSASTCVEGLRR